MKNGNDVLAPSRGVVYVKKTVLRDVFEMVCGLFMVEGKGD